MVSQSEVQNKYITDTLAELQTLFSTDKKKETSLEELQAIITPPPGGSIIDELEALISQTQPGNTEPTTQVHKQTETTSTYNSRKSTNTIDNYPWRCLILKYPDLSVPYCRIPNNRTIHDITRLVISLEKYDPHGYFKNISNLRDEWVTSTNGKSDNSASDIFDKRFKDRILHTIICNHYLVDKVNQGYFSKMIKSQIYILGLNFVTIDNMKWLKCQNKQNSYFIYMYLHLFTLENDKRHRTYQNCIISQIDDNLKLERSTFEKWNKQALHIYQEIKTNHQYRLNHRLHQHYLIQFSLLHNDALYFLSEMYKEEAVPFFVDYFSDRLLIFKQQHQYHRSILFIRRIVNYLYQITILFRHDASCLIPIEQLKIISDQESSLRTTINYKYSKSAEALLYGGNSI